MAGIDGDATSWGVVNRSFWLVSIILHLPHTETHINFIDWCSLLKLSLTKQPWGHNECDCCPHCYLLRAIS